jgi:8-oxo-dGTP diphosphatase
MSTKYNPSIHNDARPNVGVTVVPFTYDLSACDLKVLIYRRPIDAEVFPGKIALPNGVYDRRVVSTAEEAAENALMDKLKIKIPHLDQLHTFTGNDIDPQRMNTINIAYSSLLRESEVVSFNDSVSDLEWISVKKLLATSSDMYAFNHKEVLEKAYERICSQAEYTPLTTNLLPKKFTIPDFKKIIEVLTGWELNNSRFRSRIKQSGVLKEVKGKSNDGFSKPAQLYKANPNYDGYFYPKSLTGVK